MSSTSSPPKALTASALIKSKARVRDSAEVFTAEKEVNAMLDLVSPAFQKIDSTFLEPACGNGNFLIEILRRKLQIEPSTRKYFGHGVNTPMPLPKGGKAEEIITRALTAVSSIYGFDISSNNVAETRVRLWSYIVYGQDLLPKFLTGQDWLTDTFIKTVTPDNALPLAPDYEENLRTFANAAAASERLHTRQAVVSPALLQALQLVLQKNIQHGDFLTQKDAAGNPLVVGEWKFIGNKLLRTDYMLCDMDKDNPPSIGRMAPKTLTAFVRGEMHA